MPLAHLYVRYSTKKQADGDSLRRQEELAEAYCSRKGLTLARGRSLYDLGVSGYRGKNAKKGVLAGFLEAVRMRKVPPGDVLLVENIDRLTRDDPQHALILLFTLIGAGIKVVILDSEKEYTTENIGELGTLLPAVVETSRAHGESDRKSRLVKASYVRRRQTAHEQRLSKRCPGWLRPADDGKKFEKIPEAVATVLKIYRLAREGYGARRIVQQLHKDGDPTIGDLAGKWYQSYVRQILKNRAVLGEYQPCTMDNGRRVPFGDPVPDYYPSIMDEKQYWVTRHVVQERRRKGGPRGEHVRNLFGGLIHNAKDARLMTTKGPAHRGQKVYLVARGATDGVGDVNGMGFPLEGFEFYALLLLTSKDVPDVLMRDSGGKESVIAAVTAEMMKEDALIQSTKEALRKRGNRKSLLEVLADADERKEALSEEWARLRGEQETDASETLGEARALWTILHDCPPEQRADLRTRLKARLGALIESIWVLIEGDRKQKVARTQVFFKNGTVIYFDAHHPPRRGVSVEHLPDGTQRASTTQFPLDVRGYGFAAADLPPEYDFRTWRERKRHPDLGGEWVRRTVRAGVLRVKPVILFTPEPQPKAKGRRPAAG